MSERELLLLLEDIRDAALKVPKYTHEMPFEDFLADDKTIDAVVRNFEIIGEATKRVPENFKADYPQIESRGMAGLRNRTIHEYFGVDYTVVWKIKEENIPDLIEYIQQAIKSLKS
jgi:uncharacterized protein with HEPN domain